MCPKISIELTPRAGRRGTAFTLVSPHDVALVEAIEALTKTKLREHEGVDDEHVAEILTQVSRLVSVRALSFAHFRQLVFCASNVIQ